jgi:hypothetical protein
MTTTGTVPPPSLTRALAWTGVTVLATALIGYAAVEAVSPAVRRGGLPASVSTLSDAWFAAFLLCVPVYLAARRSALLALPVVALATVPQFAVATIGLYRLVADDGLEALIYVVPALVTLLCLLAAATGAAQRLLELRRTAQAS